MHQYKALEMKMTKGKHITDIVIPILLFLKENLATQIKKL